MAHRRRRRLAALLTAAALVAAACGDGGEHTSGPSRAASAAQATAPPRTVSTTIAATTSVPPRPAGELPDVGAEVTIPPGEGNFPAVVLVHGGGWVGGGPSLMSGLAAHLGDEGFLTVNARYRLAASRSPGFPHALHDVACAVRYAAAHPRSNGSVALIGFSAGAHLGAVVALTGDRYGEGCPVAGSGIPDRFVGLAGPYDVSRLGIAAVPFFGGGPQTNPDAWLAGNPQLLTGANPGLASLLLHAERDGIVDASYTADFAGALAESGSEVLVEVVEGARHSDLQDPELVGDLIVTWLER
ncbi:MAG: alpha/beta hydrolase fold domain-containing protein [Actinobacteria bacterium]|nr:alpha/beta hydrolase fold domain-containing protein [Actinomycetota bacterium]